MKKLEGELKTTEQGVKIFSESAKADLGGWTSISAPKNGKGQGYDTNNTSFNILYNVNCSIVVEEEVEENIDNDEYFMRDSTHYEQWLIPNHENKTDICPLAVIKSCDGDIYVIWFSSHTDKWYEMQEDDAAMFLTEIGIW